MTEHEQAAYELGLQYGEAGVDPRDEVDIQDVILRVTSRKIDPDEPSEDDLQIMYAFEEGYEDGIS